MIAPARFCCHFLLILSLCSTALAAPGYRELDTQQLRALLSSDPATMVVFPQSRIEYDHQHLPGAVPIPPAEFSTRLPADKGRRILFYTLSDNASPARRAAELAVGFGYRQIFVYRDGLIDWALAGYPTECTQPLPNLLVPRITTTELLRRMHYDPNLIILDCCPADKTDKLKIAAPQRIHIPLDELHRRYGEIPRHKTIAVICMTGNRSPLAARFLAAKGVVNVLNVDGGILKWTAEKKPIILSRKG